MIKKENINKSFWFKVTPDVEYTEKATPQGNFIVEVDKLLPKDSVTISYLYTYPYNVDLIHPFGSVRAEESKGTSIPVLFARQLPKWQRVVVYILMILGLIYSVQCIILLIQKII